MTLRKMDQNCPPHMNTLHIMMNTLKVFIIFPENLSPTSNLKPNNTDPASKRLFNTYQGSKQTKNLRIQQIEQTNYKPLNLEFIPNQQVIHNNKRKNYVHISIISEQKNKGKHQKKPRQSSKLRRWFWKPTLRYLFSFLLSISVLFLYVSLFLIYFSLYASFGDMRLRSRALLF